MQERFLHFVWEKGLFEHRQLVADNAETVQIVNRGSLNADSGPDFFNAQIRLGSQFFVGNVEIHVKASDWYRHGHQYDSSYNNTILHVVYENDAQVADETGRVIPCLELQQRIPTGIYQNYLDFSQHIGPFACEMHGPGMWKETTDSMKEKALLERLESKSQGWLQMLELLKGDWEEVFYRHLMRYMGFKVNAEPMEQFAAAVPMRLLLKNRHRPIGIEALLFGQSGMLEPDWPGAYPMALKEEYRFLKHKYQLQSLHAGIWKMHRMRPQNFPGLRLAQLAAIFVHSPFQATTLAQKKTLGEVYALLDVEPNSFWQTHYHFGKETKEHAAKMGKQAIDGLLLNVAIPFLYTYGKTAGKSELVLQAMQWLKKLPAEENLVTRKWGQLEMRAQSAFDSQALLGLKQLYCDQKRCLECGIGMRIISK